jgi:quinol monooxygenase YgiN
MSVRHTRFWLRWAALLAASCALTVALAGCTVGTPFRGPGFDSRLGQVRPEVAPTVLLAVTGGRVDPGRRADFGRQLRAVLEALPASDGLVGYAVRRELFGRRIWTLSVWQDEASLDRFLASPAHMRAVREGGVPRDAVTFASVSIPTALLPISWEQAQRLLDAQP